MEAKSFLDKILLEKKKYNISQLNVWGQHNAYIKCWQHQNNNDKLIYLTHVGTKFNRIIKTALWFGAGNEIKIVEIPIDVWGR